MKGLMSALAYGECVSHCNNLWFFIHSLIGEIDSILKIMKNRDNNTVMSLGLPPTY